ncbi:scyllo-inositol 2-dehydrogenase (NAD(+)) [bacterium HR17]|uniref:Scyllo-inositol 2-dehydrogenase (NAD(+)) n=1 Tax=Candidatus Fervidibacter japonicus TaxID=2035412 RepID=A0A2H5X9M6_9BACT|nr:scyllo-inositol 2-dehydrogenase (NAD(+)) [bacterium HR17]
MAQELTRREFLRVTALTGLLTAVAGRTTVKAQGVVNCAVIGTGEYGRNLLSYLIKVPTAKVVALCDIYEPHLKKALDIVGQPVATYDDYRKVLDDKEVHAVIIATPPHTHKPIALDALQAGKHVWCEVPLALTIDDARTIAKAATQTGLVFQAGLQRRYNPAYEHAVKFMRTGAIGRPTLTQAQWHQKTSWRRPIRDEKWERQLNWKLYRDTSGGLFTEVALHQFDTARWFLRALPTAVAAWGSTVLWQDGREVPDTIQCVLEFPDGVRMTYHATLTNSYQGAFDLFAGEFGTIYLSGFYGVLFKEADAPSLGWEVYAKRERIAQSEGFLLVANATKLIEQGKLPGEEGFKPALEDHEEFAALSRFVAAIAEGKKPAVSAAEGFEATVVALKAVEAWRTGTSQTIKATELQLG